MNYGSNNLSFDEAQQERLRRIGEARKRDTNEKEKAQDDKNRANTKKREERKEEQMVDEIKEEPVAYKAGRVLQSKEEIKAEAVAEVVAALALINSYPELQRLVGSGHER